MPGTSPEATHAARASATANAKIALLVAAVVTIYVIWLYVLQSRLTGLEASMRPRGVPYVLFGGDVEFKLGFRTEAILGGVALAESFLLVLLYHALKGLRWHRFIATLLVTAAAVMFVVSFQARFTSSDLYHYIYYGKAASLNASYTGDAHPAYPPGYGGLRLALKEPVPPSVYGPLWQEGDRYLMRATHTLAEDVRALRLANALALLVIFASLVMLRTRIALLAIIVLNPALYYMFVVQGHNDIVAVAAIALGFAILRRSMLVAIALGTAAGLVKVSTIGVALAALCTVGALRTRVGSAVAMLVLFAACSLLLGGSAYTHAMLYVGSEQTGTESSGLQHVVRLAVQGVLGLIALVAIVASVGFRRFTPAAVFAFPAISGLVHAWYFAWGLPYALAGQRTAAVAATTLPLIAFLCDNALIDAFGVHFTTAIFGIIVIGALVQLYRRKLTLPLAST